MPLFKSFGIVSIPKLGGRNVTPSYGTRIDRQHPLGKNLLEAWLFRENRGLTSFGYNYQNNLTIDGATWQSGRYGPALQFTSGTQIATCTNTTFSRLTNQTWAGWIRIDSAGDNIFNRIVHKRNDDNGNPSILYSNSEGTRIFRIQYAAESFERTFISPENNFEYGEWFFWAWVFEPFDIDNTMRYYKNGIQQSISLSSTTGVLPTSLYEDTFLCFGNRPIIRTRAPDALIGPTMVFDRMLTSDELHSLYLDNFQMFEIPKKKTWIFMPGESPAIISMGRQLKFAKRYSSFMMP